MQLDFSGLDKLSSKSPQDMPIRSSGAAITQAWRRAYNLYSAYSPQVRAAAHDTDAAGETFATLADAANELARSGSAAAHLAGAVIDILEDEYHLTARKGPA